jgi:hypothetical protein
LSKFVSIEVGVRSIWEKTVKRIALFLCLACLLGEFAWVTAAEPRSEIDIGAILWHEHSAAVKYFGKPTKTLPPEFRGDDWEFDYKDGNSTTGTKELVLVVIYRYRHRPTNYQEALREVEYPKIGEYNSPAFKGSAMAS